MSKKSSGLIVYRYRKGQLEIFLVHPGGPFWANKDDGAWSIPKGEYLDREDPLSVACHEFTEETGYAARGEFIPLRQIKQAGGKMVSAWACGGDFDAAGIKSNTFTIEWPPRSGKQAEFPEIDRAEWFDVDAAKRKILKGQVGFIEELCLILSYKL